MTFSERCKLAADCLPEAPYRAMLAELHQEMLAEIKQLREALQIASGAMYRIAATAIDDDDWRESSMHAKETGMLAISWALKQDAAKQLAFIARRGDSPVIPVPLSDEMRQALDSADAKQRAGTE